MRIWLDRDGTVIATVEYAVPSVCREAEILTPIGVFRQNRREGETWVYRFEGLLGQREPDAYVSDLREPGSPEWDGPVVTTTRATWADATKAFARLKEHLAAANAGTRPGVQPSEVDALMRLCAEVVGVA